MSPVTVTQSGTDVIISWSPAQANGDSITAYEVKIYNYTAGDYTLSTALCDGS